MAIKAFCEDQVYFIAALKSKVGGICKVKHPQIANIHNHDADKSKSLLWL